MLPVMPILLSLKSSPLCHTLSKAFVKSRKMPIISLPSSRHEYRLLQIIISWLMVLSPGLKPDCCSLMILCFFIKQQMWSKSTLSNTLEIHGRRDIGLQLVHKDLSFFLKSGITCASFQISGKQPSCIQKLKRSDRGSAIETAHSLRILLLIPSGPVALLVFKLTRIAYTSSGLTVS